MKTYIFRVVVEPDGDCWSVCCPVLEKYGAATWGYTQEEALKNIQEVVQMVIEELVEGQRTDSGGTFRRGHCLF